MEWLQQLHSADGISNMIAWGGLIIVVGIVYAETGLLVGFFLPGDSLLITAGVLANPQNPHAVFEVGMLSLNIALVLAAAIGDQTGYWLGHRAGAGIWNKKDGRFFKQKHLLAAQAFYAKYGNASVIAAKYVPIVRTFVPFVAGIARMPYRRFALWSFMGAILWITSLLWIGYFLGQTPLANRLDKLLVLVVFVSILPILVGGLKSYRGKKSRTVLN